METLRMNFYFRSALPDPRPSPELCIWTPHSFLQTYSPLTPHSLIHCSTCSSFGVKSTASELREPELGPRPTHVQIGLK